MTAPRCSLDARGLALQRERQARLGRDAIAVERVPGELRVALRPGFERRALDEMVAVERECCPFFLFHFDDSARALSVGVTDPALEPALDALAEGIGGGVETPGR